MKYNENIRTALSTLRLSDYEAFFLSDDCLNEFEYVVEWLKEHKEDSTSADTAYEWLLYLWRSYTLDDSIRKISERTGIDYEILSTLSTELKNAVVSEYYYLYADNPDEFYRNIGELFEKNEIWQFTEAAEVE